MRRDRFAGDLDGTAEQLAEKRSIGKDMAAQAWQGLKPNSVSAPFAARLKPPQRPGPVARDPGKSFPGYKAPSRRDFATRYEAAIFQRRIFLAGSNGLAMSALLAAALYLLPLCVHAQEAAKAATTVLPLTSTEGIEVVDGKLDVVEHNGRRALQLLRVPATAQDGSMLAILAAPEFHDGTIEVDVSGAPLPGSDPSSRGFVGVSFRTRERGGKAEYFYLRPTNARCDDQLRRNHTLQYVAAPDYPWERLRKENPGVYESYADMVPGEWTHMKIVVSGSKAALYVNGASQPSLIVNDLKLGDSRGAVGLWAHETTDAYFSNLTITRN